MRRFLIYITLLFFLAGCSSSGGIKTSYDFNPATDFSAYQTFAWISQQPFMGGDPGVSALTRQRVQNTIRDRLIAMNYQFVSDPMAADFVVSFTIGSRQEIKVDTYPSTWSGGWGRGAGYWGRGYYGGYSGTEVRVREYTEGQLAIDIFDVKTKEPSWHGTATKRITSKEKDDPLPLIQEAVARILAQFPAPRE